MVWATGCSGRHANLLRALYPKTRPREHHRRDEIATSVIEFSAFHVRRTVAIEAGPSPQPIPRWNTDLDRGEGQPVTTGHDVIGRLCPLHPPPARVEHVAQRVVALPGALPQQSQVRSRTPLVIRHVAGVRIGVVVPELPTLPPARCQTLR